MKLLHYSAEPFQFDPDREYVDDHWKPRGLWLSVEGKQDWAEWCKEEDFGIDRMKCVTEVTLKPIANVLRINTLKKFDEFNTQFGGNGYIRNNIEWGKVKALYDGVIIAPYQWKRRLGLMWYYGWDCASGVIWNLSAVADVTLLRMEEVQ